MDVEGLRANGPGDKTKVFGMQEGQDDFITNKFRVDIQYRGTAGFPPNAITFRALNGDSGDLDVRYEPDTNTRMASVFLLNPANVYHWKAIWGSGEWRVTVRDGGTSGSMLYNIGVNSPNGNYTPSPQYAYLGAPVGRSGGESASIAGATYRNVWLSNRPRPDTLGSALQVARLAGSPASRRRRSGRASTAPARGRCRADGSAARAAFDSARAEHRPAEAGCSRARAAGSAAGPPRPRSPPSPASA